VLRQAAAEVVEVPPVEAAVAVHRPAVAGAEASRSVRRRAVACAP
jgi:hypothetical protein